MIKILIVEDQVAIRELIAINLSRMGYDCAVAHNGKIAADLIEKNTYDLILLDIMLPEIDGYELIKYIEPTATPVIFITAKGSLKDRVKGLHMGADDYIVKPFETEELMARVEAVLRRVGKGKTLLEIDNVKIDIIQRTVKKDVQPVLLTVKEFDLLVMLVQNKNIVLYRERLYEKIWNEEWQGNTRTIDLHIQRLRKKLDWANKIQTVYKLGYRLEVE
ncbi:MULTISPECIES: response regulator transcription factor [unclassified Sedimentibacter]|uniref:response regulator transcription factor n=1 Tax=unclassified Sedimentibacter TaxID=2649220 RepID=UPI0027E1BF09|nr:response regulator transcription factor [Sedimentibacter sp. MB35-C1]WMJ78693.1 response regulator transcription factor [Sedimentibacter sp. MB35-C1]